MRTSEILLTILASDGMRYPETYARSVAEDYKIVTLTAVVDAMWHWGRSFLDNQPEDQDIDNDSADVRIA
jgi:hypothetical protein